MSQSPDLRLHILDVRPGDHGRTVVLVELLPYGAVLDLAVDKDYESPSQASEDPEVWRIVAGLFSGWYMYAEQQRHLTEPPPTHQAGWNPQLS